MRIGCRLLGWRRSRSIVLSVEDLAQGPLTHGGEGIETTRRFGKSVKLCVVIEGSTWPTLLTRAMVWRAFPRSPGIGACCTERRTKVLAGMGGGAWAVERGDRIEVLWTGWVVARCGPGGWLSSVVPARAVRRNPQRRRTPLRLGARRHAGRTGNGVGVRSLRGGSRPRRLLGGPGK